MNCALSLSPVVANFSFLMNEAPGAACKPDLLGPALVNTPAARAAGLLFERNGLFSL